MRRFRDLFIPGVFGLLVVITVVCVLAGCGSSAGTPAVAASTGSGSTSSAPPSTHADDGIPTISVQHLPPEARTTIGLIRSGGPFPYRQDGVVFQNREHLLPREPTGYYHEYTVETPGSPDRGARRIIRARDGTMYYTADHYDSFQRVVS